MAVPVLAMTSLTAIIRGVPPVASRLDSRLHVDTREEFSGLKKKEETNSTNYFFFSVEEEKFRSQPEVLTKDDLKHV